MSATIHILPLRTALPCRRCGGLRRVTFDQMSEAQKQWAPAGSIFPCPDCGDDAEVIPFDPQMQAHPLTDPEPDDFEDLVRNVERALNRSGEA